MQKNRKDEEEKIMEAGYEKAAEEDPEDQFPPGFRFHPTDEELITYYLAHKINKPNFTTKAIAEVDLNKCEPWDLPGKAKMGEREWYFFSSRDRKYPTGVRTNRATMAGYWKTTGKDKEIYDSGKSSEHAGMKKTLVFYRGRAPRGEKTNWVMHEYRLHPKSNSKANLQEEWVVCRIILKSKPGNKKYSTAYQAHRLSPPILPNLFNTRPSRHQVNLGLERANPSEISMADIFRYANGLRSPFPFSFPPPPAASLNLNVDTQQYFAMPPSALLGHMASPLAATDQSTLLPQLSPSSSLSFQGSCTAGSESGYGGGGDGSTARFMNIEPCVNMEGYWSAY